jgi:hypothetical protein
VTRSPFDTVLAIMEALTRAKIAYSLADCREEAITIRASVPGQRWEIDVLRDGDVDFEVFRADGKIVGETELLESIRAFSD